MVESELMRFGHLTQDLWLAQDHGIQAAGDGTQVEDDFFF
jgi:hypothetical protein